MSSLRTHLLATLLASTAMGSGCSRCGVSSSTAVRIDGPGDRPAGASTEARTVTVWAHEVELLPTAVALRSGSRVWMWVDGRPLPVASFGDGVAWSPRGFEFTTSNGLTKVLAPGGSLYYRLSILEEPKTRSANELFDGVSAPPPGWSVDYVDGAGGKRVQAFLNGPEGRRVRLGLFRTVPDDQVWLEGELPADGERSPPLATSVHFRRTLEGGLVATTPEGGDPLAWNPVPEDQLAAWMAAVEAFRTGGPKLTAGIHVAADLDRDGHDETVLCVDGRIGMLDPRCVLIDEVDQETRMYPVGLPWEAGGPAPIGFTVDGVPYLMMVSGTSSTVGFVLRYYGAGWVAEPIR